MEACWKVGKSATRSESFPLSDEPDVCVVCQSGMNATNLQSDIDETVAQSAAAKLLHPEDISVGDNVTLAIQSYNYPSFFWCMADPAIMPPDETVRLSFLPNGDEQAFQSGGRLSTVRFV